MRSSKLVPARFLIGSRVYSGSGESLGKIDELVVDADTGGIPYAVVAVDAASAAGRLFVVPWSELDIRSPSTPPVRSRAGSEQFVVPESVTHVFGGYWDVYRMAFRSNGRVIGIPYPMYPNRFTRWSRGLGSNLGALLVLEPRDEASRRGKSAADSPGRGRSILISANWIDWRTAFETVWKADGRAPRDVDRLRVFVP